MTRRIIDMHHAPRLIASRRAIAATSLNVYRAYACSRARIMLRVLHRARALAHQHLLA